MIAAATKAGVVRVVNRQTGERTLIKGMEGAVQDIAFAHIPQEIILAIVDMKGNLFIHKAYEVVSDLMCSLLLHIMPDTSCVPQAGDFFRVIWCPYIPEVPDDIEDNDEPSSSQHLPSYLLALSRGRKVELWNVKMVIDIHQEGPVKPGMVETGYLEIMEHTKPIVDAAFAPDGTAVATASLDGEVKFFQVYMENGKKPKCLHQWTPHRGQPVSSLFFLDNHKNYNPDIQFWKFAITGANNNSELKVWSCESWTCLQTLVFQVRPDRENKLNACIDLASGYLLLSDFHHKVLYVLELYTNNKETVAAIVSISEFLLPYPILSFGIVDAGVTRFKSENLDEVCNDENDEESVLGVLVRMYLVQPKSLQDCQVAFIPPTPGTAERSLVDGSLAYHDMIPDIPVNISNGELNTSNPNLQDMSSSHTHSSLHLNLMTPDAFNSPVKLETSGSSLKQSHMEEVSYSNTTTLVASPHSLDDVDNTLLTGLGNNDNTMVLGFASGGSSPSREVQEILGEGKRFYQETDDIHQDEEQVEIIPEGKVAATVWPEIPMLRASEVRKNEEHARRSVNTGDNSASVEEMWKINQRLETSISSMIHIMNSLMQASEEQASEIKHLREEIHHQNLLCEIDKIISRSAQQQLMLLEKVLSSKENKHQQESLAAAVSQSVINFLSTKFADSVNNEVSKTVGPIVMSQMDSLKHQIHVELSQKLSTTDHLLKENITKLVHSKSVMDVLSAAVVSSLTPVISQCYRDYFTNMVMPSFEKSCSMMFSQVNETFNKGSKEFVNIIETQTRRYADKTREQGAQVQSLQEVLRTSVAQMNADMKKSVVGIEKHVMEAVTNALSIQQATLEGSVIAAVRSRAVTPAPHVLDTHLQQAQILQLISQGQINTAFQQVIIKLFSWQVY